MNKLNSAALAALVQELVSNINELAKPIAAKLHRPIQVMEVCGGHTHAIFHAGLDQLLVDEIEWVHGPGCPVCVMPKEAIDRALLLSQQKEVIIASFGDLLRVPGTHGCLLEAKSKGADVRVLYSPIDAINLAQKEPDRQVIFLAIGFDTTMPSIALTVQQASKMGLSNLRFLCFHIPLMPTLYKLLDDDQMLIDGFIGPGHVSIVLGRQAFVPIASRYRKPLVIAGFEAPDILKALWMLLKQLEQGRCEIENAYSQVVSEQGNKLAQAAIKDVFATGKFNWRGVGDLAESITGLTAKYAAFDANAHQCWPERLVQREPDACAKVIVGKLKPYQCPHFSKDCQPSHPLGPLMVSSEGACAAYYQYKPGPLSKEPRLG